MGLRGLVMDSNSASCVTVVWGACTDDLVGKDVKVPSDVNVERAVGPC